MTALIGPSGCGKSTFLRILNRMHEVVPGAQLAGSVELDGLDIYGAGQRADRHPAPHRHGVPEAQPVSGDDHRRQRAVRAQVLAAHAGQPGRPGRGDADQGAACGTRSRTGSASWEGRLSGGQQQRLCIARALAVRPRVLLMDEPCSALDPTSTLRIEHTIKEIADEVTVVIVTHNMQQAQRVSDYCAFFLAEENQPGRVVESGRHRDDVRPALRSEDVRTMSMATSVDRARTGAPAVSTTPSPPALPSRRAGRGRTGAACSVPSPAWASPVMQSTGSSFAGVAIQQWVGQTSTLYGLNINWQVQSSVVGLNDFAQNQVDFGASDIPYSSGQAQSDPELPVPVHARRGRGLSPSCTTSTATTASRSPTSISTLRSSTRSSWVRSPRGTTRPSPPSTRSWSATYPSTKIVPVYRTDASGENYLLSDYLLHQDAANFTAAQTAFHARRHPRGRAAHRQLADPDSRRSRTPSRPTRGWPAGNPVGQSGSDNAANYVSSHPATARSPTSRRPTPWSTTSRWPICSMPAGRTVQPTSLNVATALEAAILHADLTQDLTNVYTNPLPNAYPLSAYSYLVTPCSPTLAGPRGSCARRQRRVDLPVPEGPGTGPVRRLHGLRRPAADGHSSGTRRCLRTWCRRTSTPSAG